jgi:hypothetical protein
MLKKLLLIALMLVLPIQVSAGIDMSFKHQATVSNVEAKTSPHTCHQDISASNKDAVALDAKSDSGSCSSCVLCVGSGFISTHFSLNSITSPGIFNSSKTSFASRDVSSLIKPPIL